ncbi:MAG TPA: alpha/beta hydrolase [Acidimicrobiia bacterium]|nr:alpha/beta hydrolase [Acidimicrobiia bacterium]
MTIPTTISSHDGLTLTGELSGRGVAVLLAHANGFCKEMWRPVTEEVDGIVALAIDQRGHGGSAIGSPPYDWWDLGRDALTWSETMAAPRIGVGHSSGGAALVKSELLRPGTWSHLVLVEPIVFPGPFQRAETHPLVEGALRRRPGFGTREETRAAYAGRGPFRRWTDAALDLYVEHGFRDDADGRRVLVCSPEVEAEFYRMATAHGAWDRLGEVACPVTLIVGEDSDSHPVEFATIQAARFQQARLVVVPDAGHFVPMEKPGVVADAIRQALRGEGVRGEDRG